MNPLTDSLTDAAALVADMREQVRVLSEELERERMRLAAVGVLASSRNAEHIANMLPEYDSASLADVRRLVADADALRKRIADATSDEAIDRAAQEAPVDQMQTTEEGRKRVRAAIAAALGDDQ